MKKIILILTIWSLLLTPVLSLAAETEITAGLEATAEKAGISKTEATAESLGGIVGRIINYAFGTIAVVFVTVILIGGYFWMIAKGNEERVTKAKTFLLNGIFGLMVVFLVYALVALVIWAVGFAANAPGVPTP
ncbi:MAG: hypothetical protein RB292_04325 [Patescibacteria group bacterium]|jgi:hypothetical protein|nr:hypothetical protein [Patescibacteria group bacterium]